MRRLMGVAAFALLLTVPVWAQRGGGGHAGGFGGGHAGGFGGHAAFSGHASGGYISSGNLAGRNGFSRGVTRPFNQARYANRFANQRRIANQARFRFPRRFDNIGERQFRNRNCFVWGCRGFGYGYGYYPWGWGYYDPFLWGWWDHDSNYSQDSDNQSAYVDQLSAENAELRQMLQREEEDRDQDAYARRPEPRPQPKSPSSDDDQSSAMMPATVLVFRDQHKQEVSNYAIVGSTLWSYVPQHNQKIPLSDLDIPATVKANDDRGVTFRVPAPNQGQ